MLGSLGSPQGVGDERARQLMRDASDLFEGHIAGGMANGVSGLRFRVGGFGFRV